MVKEKEGGRQREKEGRRGGRSVQWFTFSEEFTPKSPFSQLFHNLCHVSTNLLNEDNLDGSGE